MYRNKRTHVHTNGRVRIRGPSTRLRGLRAEGLALKAQGLRFRASGLGFRVTAPTEGVPHKRKGEVCLPLVEG